MISARYNPTWHCIVGRNFGSYVTHETRLVEILIYDNNIGSYICVVLMYQIFRHFIYFYLGQVAILLFKSG